MASYPIKWKTSAKKELKRIDKKIIPKIIEAVENLANNPYPQGCKKMIGSQSLYRIRVGNYRVIYDVFSQGIVIEVIKVGHRQNIYKSH